MDKEMSFYIINPAMIFSFSYLLCRPLTNILGIDEKGSRPNFSEI